MRNNFALLLIIYLFYNFSKKNFDITEKKYVLSKNKKHIVKQRIEIFKINKETQKILLEMLKKIHNIFMKCKTIYYVSDELLYGYIENKKFNKYCEYINLYVIEETFDIDFFKELIKYTDINIVRNFGFYKIISNQINQINKYSICINLFLVEKVKDKIVYCQTINEIYFNLFQLKKNDNHNFDDIFPIQKVRFENMYICIPNNPEKIINKFYDNNYKNKITFNNIYSPISYIYTKLTGIRNHSIEINR